MVKGNGAGIWGRVTLAAILLLSWFVALLAARARVSGSSAGQFLIYNLFLAGIPLVAALLFEQACVRARPAAVRATAFLAWLSFLPNAPYIGTDLLHLKARPPVPMWFDAALLGSAAACGVWLGYLSTAIIHRAIARVHGSASGWLVACSGLALSGIGIYVGRFLRWNSWDLVFRPRQIAMQLLLWVSDPASGRLGAEVTAIYGGGLVVGYVALRLLTESALQVQRPEAERAAA